MYLGWVWSGDTILAKKVTGEVCWGCFWEMFLCSRKFARQVGLSASFGGYHLHMMLKTKVPILGLPGVPITSGDKAHAKG